MEENRTMSAGKMTALAVVGGLAALILSIYLGLCIFVGASKTVLHGVYAGEIDLSAMSMEQAQQAVDAWLARQYDDVTYMLFCGESTATLQGAVAAVDGEAVARQAYMVGRAEPFLKRGAVILSHLVGRRSVVPCPVQLSAEGQVQLKRALDALSAAENVPLVETVWSVEGEMLNIVRGVTGVSVDAERAQAALLEVMQLPGDRAVEVPVIKTQPVPLDLQQLHDQIFAQAADAYVERDEQGKVQVVPHVVGVDFDPVSAQAQCDALPEGAAGQIQLTLTQPAVTQRKLEGMLFADVLGECTTNIGGTEYRLNNVIVAAKAMDGTILMPGDVFSYNDTLGPRTVANGYQPAPAYIGGKTVDEVGGGICQNSSTLYLATLRANLEIVERTNHMYAVGYVPDGLDATVAYNALDFKFRNNTEHPIRVETKVNGRKITVKLHGTDTQHVTVKMVTETLSTTPYEVTYKPDATVAVGKTVVDTTAYTGRKVRAFRCVYDANGNLISRTQESMNNYRHRDKVILYNPADAEKLGLVDENGVVHTTVQPKRPAPVVPAPEPEQTQPVQPAPEPEQETPVVAPQPEAGQTEQEQLGQEWPEVQPPVQPDTQGDPIEQDTPTEGA